VLSHFRRYLHFEARLVPRREENILDSNPSLQ